MINLGDMVIQRWAQIREPNGNLRQLEESPYYGIVIAEDIDIPSTTDPPRRVHRVLWFEKETGVRRDEQQMTIELEQDLKKISK